ncbi:MAG: enoyl-CoA hydratase/isomerase family protein, partial [Dehalococcoidia bacterium]|nr:enoyl-CoA hydratase/isomerase family protein [Dehalococcoidia bacterium]
MYKNFLLDQKGALATVTLNRPEKRNPVNEEMLQEFLDILTKLRDDPENRIIVITGSGPAFCSGADITRLKGAPTEEERLKQFDLARGKRRVYLQRALEMVDRMEQVTIAAINGFAVGGGLHLALACDFRVAADTATFWYPEITL